MKWLHLAEQAGSLDDHEFEERVDKAPWRKKGQLDSW
jgi:hypothetical protein